MSNLTAQELDVMLKTLRGNIDQLFLIVMGILVFLMQAGFAFLEVGAVRSKNTTNILLKNFLDAFIGAVAYWLFGYAFGFGEKGNGFIGYSYFALADLPAEKFSHWFFHYVFAASTATIVSGSLAERTEFKAYLMYSVFLTGFLYPVVSHWAWDVNGWLFIGAEYTKDNVTRTVTFQDFAGSGAVHTVSGLVALVGAAIVGPRIGRFVNGVPMPLKGHTVPKAALGGFILFFGFLAFNGGSNAAIAGEGAANDVSLVIVNTVIGGAAGALTSLIIKRLGFAEKHWSLLFTMNGGFTGMVSQCSGCNTFHPYAAFVIGIIGGITYVAWSIAMLRFQIDDPLDAVAVHLGGGIWGVLAAPIFNMKTGIFYARDNHSFRLFGWNVLGLVVIMAWCAVLAFSFFFLLKLLGQLRVSKEVEIKGLDIPKHGEPAYPVESYGNGWEIPSEERKIPFPFYQTSITTFVNVIPTKNGTYKEPAMQHGQPGQAIYQNEQPKVNHSQIPLDLPDKDTSLENPGRKPSVEATDEHTYGNMDTAF
nr:putative ammonium transporter 1 [Pocillopora verrucosa]